MDGGSERIRTSGTVARSHAFQACSLNHSDTLPYGLIITYLYKKEENKGLIVCDDVQKTENQQNSWDGTDDGETDSKGENDFVLSEGKMFGVFANNTRKNNTEWGVDDGEE